MNRSQRHRSRYRHRRSSSSIRTIIQLNSQQESIKSNNIVIDPKILWTKKKCHKYAMFKVGQKLKVVRNLISVWTDITSFSYQQRQGISLVWCCLFLDQLQITFQVFGKDFTLCLLLGPFQLDPILSTGHDVKVSVYGKGSKYGSRKVTKMKLQLCEGHVISQVFSAVRGYVWKDKVDT